MPEGTTVEAIRERTPWIIDLCKRERFRFSPRLHIDIWGNERGRWKGVNGERWRNNFVRQSDYSAVLRDVNRRSRHPGQSWAAP